MILLLTRENSSYDSATKTFWFKMDKQLDSSVKVIRIQTFSFAYDDSNLPSWGTGLLGNA